MENVRMTRATRFSLTRPQTLVPKFGGHPWGAVGACGLSVDLADPLGQELVLALPQRPRRPAGKPLVVAGPIHVQDLAEPLHLVGVPVVVDELEAAPHQFVSPAKYLAALRRMSRSEASFRSFASSSATLASSCLIRSSG